MPILTLDDLAAVELPPDVQAELDTMLGRAPKPAPVDTQSVLAQLAHILIPERQEAIDGRLMSGIEYAWDKAEEGYAAIDDVNRAESVNRIKWQKPASPDGGLISKDRLRDDGDLRSTVLPPIIARYVDAGTAKVCEIILSPDDKSFSLEPTPHPDLVKGKEDTRQLQAPDGTLLQRDARPDELPSPNGSPPVPAGPPPPQSAQPSAPLAPVAGGAPAPPPSQPLTVRDLAKETLDQAEAAAKQAEKIILDWMVEGHYTAEMRKVVFDAGKFGVGVLKGPYPVMRRAMAVSRDQASKKVTMIVEQKVVPGYKRITPWNLYPDPSCGENIQDGEYLWERDFITERRLRELKHEEGYLGDMIEQVLKEGPGKRYLDARTAELSPKDKRYEIWYRTGYLKREQVEALNVDAAKDLKKDLTLVPMLCTVVNDTVIRGVLHPLDSGRFNYHAFPWRRRADHWAGSGVAEQLEAPVRIIVGAIRAMLDNGGQSAGGQIVIDSLAISPVDGSWAITPNKLWKMSGDAQSGDVEKAFKIFTFPNLTAALMEIVTLGFRLCEESTNIPLITQGQSGKTTPDTLGATQLQDSNANQMLRGIAENCDDFVTEPVAEQNYELLLLDPDVPDEAKGDFTINAHGSTALVDRHLQNQMIAQMGAVVSNPLFGADPKRWFEQWLRANRLVPMDFKFSKEEQEKLDQTPPPKAPIVQVAEIKAHTDLETSKAETDHDQTMRTAEMQAKMQLELESLKTQLAALVMKLQTQKELAGRAEATDLHKHHNPPPVVEPPMEPAGRAPAGESFQK
jgi:hypothetical protein